MIRRPPRSTLFPNTPLFRSVGEVAARRAQDGEPLLPAEHVESPHDAHRILRAPRRGAERAEVVSAAERRQRPPHRIHVERLGDMPGVTEEERARDRSNVDEVRVALAGRRAPRVEASRRLPHISYSEVPREM